MKQGMLIGLGAVVAVIASAYLVQYRGRSPETGEGVTETVEIPPIAYSKSPKPIPDVTPEDIRRLRIPPRPFSVSKRIAIINKVRMLAGMSAVSSTNLPCEVTLTPDYPRSGDNYYTLWDGDNITTPPTAVSDIDQTSALHFRFATIPGVTYLLDIWTWQGLGAGPLAPAGGTWQLEGAVDAAIMPTEEGHVIAAFTADYSVTSVRIRLNPVSESVMQVGSFYSACLTRVN